MVSAVTGTEADSFEGLKFETYPGRYFEKIPIREVL
jgi:hypothetical protein